MRRLLILVAVLVLVDTMLYAALVPLLPRFTHQFGLSKAGAGALVAAYAAGALLGSLPGGFAASHWGVRRAVLTGLALMGLASLGFAFASSVPTLFAARIVQGAGSAFTWAGAFAWLLAAAPARRRGEMIGIAMGAAVFGALIGPLLGALAALAGRGAVFSALSALAVALAAITIRIEPAATQAASGAALRGAFANRTFAGGLLLLALGSLLFGIVDVLAPLHLSAHGWGAGAIGAIWVAGAALETVQSPMLGRLSDRRGALVPARIALGLGAALSLGLATGARPLIYAPLLVATSAAYGALFTPSFALIADGAESAGLAQGLAFGVMNAAWALGALVGPAAGGALASATGDWIPLLVAAAMCAGTLAMLRGRLREGARSPSVRMG